MAHSVLREVPNQRQVERKLDGARFQIDALRAQLERGDVAAQPAAESSAVAAIRQMIDALDATLYGFNMLLPDPLPAHRVNRRNLRDRFHAMQAESRALRAIDEADRAEGGWLAALEAKASASPFFELLSFEEPSAGPGIRFWKNPEHRSAGVEPSAPVEYLNDSLSRMERLIQRVADLVPADADAYRQAAKQQAQRII